MDYRYTATPQPVVTFLSDTLASTLRDGKKVLWLVPGGSAIRVAVDVATRLRETKVPLENLTVTLTDERYGDYGHTDENWPKLVTAGFALPGATLYRVLQTNKSRSETTELFDAFLRKAYKAADVRIGFFGIGADGHTSGIKPHSFDTETTRLAVSYQGEDFERITTTPAAIAALDIAITYATGDEKQATLARLLHDGSDITEQPDQCLKRVPTSILFTDQKL